MITHRRIIDSNMYRVSNVCLLYTQHKLCIYKLTAKHSPPVCQYKDSGAFSLLKISKSLSGSLPRLPFTPTTTSSSGDRLLLGFPCGCDDVADNLSLLLKS